MSKTIPQGEMGVDRIRKLTDLHEKIRLEMLGVDWEYKKELDFLLKKVEVEITKCHVSMV